MNHLKEVVQKNILDLKNQLINISKEIHAHPELAFEEYFACNLLIDTLKKADFTMKQELGGLPTAFEAVCGKGKLHIAVCAEYDALPHVGHACGHNIIAAAAIGTALGLKPIIDQLDLTLHIMGTPAEEKGGGKIMLLERGCFENIHAAMMIHPAESDGLFPNIIAAEAFEISYQGKEAHAAAYPEKGINASDAMTVAQVAIGLLRQQMETEDRVHGYVKKGGEAANIIPALTKAEYIVRSSTLTGLEKIRSKVENCFKAGALATGAALSITSSEKTYANMVHDKEIAYLYKRNAEKLGRLFTDSEDPKDNVTASTDMGNVSQVLPSIHPMIGIHSAPATNHQPEFTAHCVTPEANQAILDGSIAMAWTIIDIVHDTSLRERLLVNKTDTKQQ